MGLKLRLIIIKLILLFQQHSLVDALSKKDYMYMELLSFKLFQYNYCSEEYNQCAIGYMKLSNVDFTKK